MTEAVELGLKSLYERTSIMQQGLECVSKKQAKTTSDMNHTLDMIREMREKVQTLLRIQDHISNQYKNVDKAMLGKEASSYEFKSDSSSAPIKRKPRSISPEPEREPASTRSAVKFEDAGSSDEDYKPAPRKSEPMKFDELSDDESPKSDDKPAAEPELTLSEEDEMEREKDKAKAAEKQRQDEFEEDERLLEGGDDDHHEPTEDELAQLEEEEALKKEEEDLARLEEEERLKNEEDELLALEEEEALRKEEEELARLEAEEADIAKAEEEELARKIAEEELQRLEEEELAREEEELRKLEEEEAKLIAEEEANKLKAEEESKGKKPAGKFAPLKPKPGPGKITNKFGGGKNKVVFK